MIDRDQNPIGLRLPPLCVWNFAHPVSLIELGWKMFPEEGHYLDEAVKEALGGWEDHQVEEIIIGTTYQ